ncbi:MAG: LPXTG cell wall anchor domain-containing protein [Aeromicrobium sp.]
MLDAILPDTGGARLGLLVLGVGLVAAGGWLVSRRRRTA